MKHSDALENLKVNFQRISAAKDVYDRLKGDLREARSKKARDEVERLGIQLLYAKETVLRLTLDNKKLLASLERHGADADG